MLNPLVEIFGLKIASSAGKIVRAPMALVTIEKATINPMCLIIVYFEKARTKNPTPTEMAFIIIPLELCAAASIKDCLKSLEIW